MLTCFSHARNAHAIPITLVTKSSLSAWQEKQSERVKAWLMATSFSNEVGKTSYIPGDDGAMAEVVCCVSDNNGLYDIGHLPLSLPVGLYYLADNLSQPDYFIGWGLGAYQFSRYKKPTREAAQLYLPMECADHVLNIVESQYLVRDLINTPADDMGPSELADMAENLAQTYHARCKQIIGEDLLRENYASIYTVGRASDDAPRLIDFVWGNGSHPKVTLVGKGVCFDTGGLDLKPSNYMLLMKKDMGGSANVLGLARLIMQAKLPVRLRVLIPAVENAVGGNAYRPGDVIKSRQGLTIEVGNTDAEGRVVLADALTEAVSEGPELLIDIATLTGAARIALGTDLPALFSNNDAVAEAVIKHGKAQNDPVWRLPLFELYREYLNSQIADINNNATDAYGGAITAALFLKEFVPNNIAWLHFDVMAWNVRQRPGRPQGGEAMAMRALFAYLAERYAR